MIEPDIRAKIIADLRAGRPTAEVADTYEVSDSAIWRIRKKLGLAKIVVGFDWNAKADDTLIRMWGEGATTAKIGAELGVSKDSVISRARKLPVVRRPSPIIRTGVQKDQSGSKALPAAYEPPIPSVTMPTERYTISGRVGAVSKRGVNGDAVRGPTLSTTPDAPQRVRMRRDKECCWPIGEPGTSDFRMCGANSAAGKPYCPEHCERAYVRIREHQPERVSAGAVARVFGS